MPCPATGGVVLRGSIHDLGEVTREIAVEVDDPFDVVVELSDEADVATQVVRDLGLMILVYLIDEKPVLVQYVLDLHKALLECLQHPPINLSPIAKS